MEAGNHSDTYIHYTPSLRWPNHPSAYITNHRINQMKNCWRVVLPRISEVGMLFPRRDSCRTVRMLGTPYVRKNYMFGLTAALTAALGDVSIPDRELKDYRITIEAYVGLLVWSLCWA